MFEDYLFLRIHVQTWAGTEFRSRSWNAVLFFWIASTAVLKFFFLRVSQSTAVLNPKKAVRSRSSCDTAIQGLERAILALDRTKNAILALERAIQALERAILLSNRSFV